MMDNRKFFTGDVRKWKKSGTMPSKNMKSTVVLSYPTVRMKPDPKTGTGIPEYFRGQMAAAMEGGVNLCGLMKKEHSIR